MSEKCCNNNNSDNPLTSRLTNGGKNGLARSNLKVILGCLANPYTNTNKEKIGSFFPRTLAYVVNGFPR